MQNDFPNYATEIDKAIARLRLCLEDKGFNKQDIEKIAGYLIEVITNNTLLAIMKTMTKEETEKWYKFVDTGANEAQQHTVLSELYKRKSGETIEDLQDRITLNIIENSISEITESEELTKKISNMDPTAVQTAMELLATDQVDQAINMVNSY